MLFVFAFAKAQSSSFYNKDIKAEIWLEQNGEFVEVKGVASNFLQGNVEMRYELTVFKIDSLKNTSKSSQSGRGVLKARNKAFVGNTTVNLNYPGVIRIMLLIYDINDKLVGKDLKEIKKGTFLIDKEDNRDKSYEGIAITGIVLDKTTTKPAKDFFDDFYMKYNLYKLNGKEPVVIREQFAQGRNSMIKIFVGTQLIHQFYVNPRSDYMESMVDPTIYKVYQHFQRLENTITQH